MKKLLTIGASVLITSAIFYSCSLLKALDEVQQNGFFCSNYSPYPVNKMDKQEVISMVRNYYQNQYRAINSSCATSGKLVNFPTTNNVDSRAVFFNLDTLKRLIYYIEKASQQFSVQDRQNLGMNIYFASYPHKMNMTKWGHDYTNSHTLIMIPSIFDNTSQTARDFDLNNSLSLVNVTSPLYIDKGFLNNASFTTIPGVYFKSPGTTPGPGAMNSQNHGTATPPPPTTNDLLTIAQ